MDHFLPHLLADIRHRLGDHADGGPEGLSQCRRAGRVATGQFAKGEPAPIIELLHDAIGPERGLDFRQPPQHVSRPKGSLQRLDMRQAIEHRQHRHMPVHRRAQGGDGIGQIIGLGGHDRDVIARAQFLGGDGLHREGRIAKGADNAQTMLGQGLAARRADQKGHIPAGLGQAAAEISTQRPGAQN